MPSSPHHWHRRGAGAAQGHSVRVGRAAQDPGFLAGGTACFSPSWEIGRGQTVMDTPRYIQSSARVRQVLTELTGAGEKDRAEEQLETQGKEEGALMAVFEPRTRQGLGL